MNTRLAFTSIISILALTHTSAIAGISDFYVSSTSGKLFHVDSQTLQATEIDDLDGFFNASTDIEYMGGGQLFASNDRTIYRYDLNTGSQTIELDRDSEGIGGIIGVDGLSKTPDGNLHVRRSVIAPGIGLFYQGFEYNINNGSYQSYGSFDIPDHHDYEILSSSRMLTLHFGTLAFFNPDTGEIESRFSVGSPDGFKPISILNIDGGLMLMSPDGDLHTLDLDSQNSTYYGHINGTGASYLYGATVPAPSIQSTLGTMLLITTRRRRQKR